MQNNNSKDFFKFIIYGIIFVTFICIALNSSTREFISSFYEIHKLKKSTEQITFENEEYKKKLNYLRTKPREIEKAIKTDLDVISETEIEYVFDDSDEKNEAKSEK